MRKYAKYVKISLFVLFGIYMFILISLLFFDVRFGRMAYAHGGDNMPPYSVILSAFFREHTNFIPFSTVAEYVTSFAENIKIDPQTLSEVEKTLRKQAIDRAVVNIGGNLAAFMPMGFFLPALFPKTRKLSRFCVTLLCALVLIETVQVFTMTGSCDTDDILLNLGGALIIFGVMKIKFVRKICAKLMIC